MAVGSGCWTSSTTITVNRSGLSRYFFAQPSGHPGAGPASGNAWQTAQNQGWQWPWVHQWQAAAVVWGKQYSITVHPTGKAGTKCFYRTKQWLFEKGTFRCLPLLHLTRGKANDRRVAAGLQLFKASPGVGLCTPAGIYLIRSLLITKKNWKILIPGGPKMRGAYIVICN